MANIYLRVPTYVAQFYRSRDIEHPLSEFEPVIFSPFQQESAMIASSIIFIDEQSADNAICFSERMWKNILNGRKPQGGKAQLKRDPQEWPSMDEILFLTNTQRNKKTDGFDYLCIAAPKTIVIGGHYKPVTNSFAIPARQANELVRQLRMEFVRILLNWVRNEQSLCDKRGIQRDVIMCIDHFFYHYNMCLGTNGSDRDSMRRMAMRWLEEAKMLADDINDEDVLFEYENETSKQMPDIETMIEEIKTKS